MTHLYAAALIISSLIGDPRVPRAQQHPRFIWTDHVALARGDDPERALRYSQVRDPVAEHAKRAYGRIAVFVRGHLKWPTVTEPVSDGGSAGVSKRQRTTGDLFATQLGHSRKSLDAGHVLARRDGRSSARRSRKSPPLMQ